MSFGLRFIFCALAAAAMALVAQGQELVLDNFNSGQTTGAAVAGTSWAGQVTQNATSITVGGSARDDNGWAVVNRTINASSQAFLLISAQRDAGHAAPVLTVQFEDRSLHVTTFSVRTDLFAVGTITQVQVPLMWTAGFDPANITGWNMGGGTLGTVAFRMTFDQLSLLPSAAPGLPTAPRITSPGSTQTVALGATVSFSVAVTGTAPLTYQWSRNGVALTSNTTATTATLTLSNVVAGDAGSYTCTVSNAGGSATSDPYMLSVNAPVASIFLGGLSTTYSGASRTATATTSPSGLPVSITYNGSLVAPVEAGSYAVVAMINHPGYTGRATGTMVVARAPQSIAFAPLPVTVQVGVPFTFGASAASGGPVILTLTQGRGTLAGTSFTAADTAAVTVRATQAGTDNYLPGSADFTFTAAKRNQSIAFAAPADRSTEEGPLTLSATATSGLAVTFAVVSGPAVFDGEKLIFSTAGTVIVRATQAGNDTFNAAPDVTRTFEITGPSVPTGPVTQPSNAGRLINLSILADLTTAGDEFTLGAVIGGAGTAGGKPLLVRAAGPSLAPLGVVRPLGDPMLEFFAASTKIGENDNWGGGTTLSNAFVAVGAFPYTGPATTDSALSTTLQATGPHSVRITGKGGSTGTVLAELYDATPSDSMSATTPRLINVSVLKQVGEGFTVGFVIGGSTSRTVLIRAIGPGLAPVGVPVGFLADPQLKLFASSVQRDTNDNWGGGASLAATMTQVGAFVISADSRDAALSTTLDPGAYSVQVSGVAGGRGLVLVEVYEVP